MCVLLSLQLVPMDLEPIEDSIGSKTVYYTYFGSIVMNQSKHN